MAFGILENRSLRTIAAVGLGVAASALAACSGAPPEDGSPDYEVDITARPPDNTGRGGSSGDAPTEGSTTEPTSSDGPSSSSGGSSSGGSSGTSSDGGTGSTSSSGAPAPKPTTVTLMIDGAKFSVTSTEIWAGVSKAGTYDLFIRVTGPNAGAGSDIHLSATKTGTGCNNTSNYITYRPAGDTQYMPKSANEPGCGLSITSLPTAVGGRFIGTFKATLYGINTTTPKSRNVDLSFDVLRTK
jgi:hypothetical protein